MSEQWYVRAIGRRWGTDLGFSLSLLLAIVLIVVGISWGIDTSKKSVSQGCMKSVSQDCVVDTTGKASGYYSTGYYLDRWPGEYTVTRSQDVLIYCPDGAVFVDPILTVYRDRKAFNGRTNATRSMTP